MLDIQRSLQSELETTNLVPAGAAWEMMTGGRSNMVWKVGQDFVCKLFLHRDNPLFANSASDELLCLTALKGEAIAPEPVGLCRTSFGEAVLYRHIRGHIWRDDIAAVAQLLGRLHKFPAPDGLRRGDMGWPQIAARGADILSLLKPAAADELRRNRPKQTNVPDCGFCFIHGDVVAANIIVSQDGLRLIDWQSPALGDPVSDLFCFLSPAMQIAYGVGPLNKQDSDTFLATYPDRVAVSRLLALLPVLHWRMAAYCAWRVEQGDDVYRAAQDAELAALNQMINQQP